MEYATAFYWKKGKEAVNRDSILIQKVISAKGTILMACICNGVHGQKEAILAAGYVAEVMGEWFYKQFLKKIEKGYHHLAIKRMGQRLFYRMNEALVQYGTEHQKNLETGVIMLLCVQDNYYIFRVGECNAYILKRKSLRRISGCSVIDSLGSQRRSKPDYYRGCLRGVKGILLCKESIYSFLPPKWMEVGIKKAKDIREESLQRTIEEIGDRVVSKQCKLNQKSDISPSIVFIKPNVFKERRGRKEIICKKDIRL